MFFKVSHKDKQEFVLQFWS